MFLGLKFVVSLILNYCYSDLIRKIRTAWHSLEDLSEILIHFQTGFVQTNEMLMMFVRSWCLVTQKCQVFSRYTLIKGTILWKQIVFAGVFCVCMLYSFIGFTPVRVLKHFHMNGMNYRWRCNVKVCHHKRVSGSKFTKLLKQILNIFHNFGP